MADATYLFAFGGYGDEGKMLLRSKIIGISDFMMSSSAQHRRFQASARSSRHWVRATLDDLHGKARAGGIRSFEGRAGKQRDNLALRDLLDKPNNLERDTNRELLVRRFFSTPCQIRPGGRVGSMDLVESCCRWGRLGEFAR